MKEKTQPDWFTLDGQRWPFVQWPDIPRFDWKQGDIDQYRPYAIKDEVMVDIGAFVGDTLFPFAVLGLDIVAFEPNPTTRAYLMAQAEILLCRKGVNIDVFPYAIGALNEKATFTYTSDLVNGGRTVPHHYTPVEVEIRKWDDRYLNGNRLCYLKVDAEGMDQEILYSMEPTILRHKPVIRAEVLRYLDDKARRDFKDWIARIHYHEEQENPRWLVASDETFDVTLIPNGLSKRHSI